MGRKGGKKREEQSEAMEDGKIIRSELRMEVEESMLLFTNAFIPNV